MSTGEDWSPDEVEAAVADYFEMLRLELAGTRFNKAERNLRLRERLSGRSRGSVEFKHQNISAVLQEWNRRFIVGYKPRGNYQGLLADATFRYLQSHPDLQRALEKDSFAVKADPSSKNRPLEDILDQPPAHIPRTLLSERIRAYEAGWSHQQLDDSKKRALGAEGEEFVLWFERRRLEEAGKANLANCIEHVSLTRGDGAGYDIKSFDADGTDRHIEVKTTTYGKRQPFFVSINEVEFSKDFESTFQLYRLFNFGNSERIFTLKGSLEQTCSLEPTQFRATF